MAKSNTARRKSHTHFEQIPIKVVKKIAEPEAPKNHKVARMGVEPISRKKG